MIAISLAPTLGWAAQSALAFLLFSIVGMTTPAIVAAFGIPLVAALLCLRADWRATTLDGEQGIPAWAVAGAMLLAFLIMRSVLPHHFGNGVVLAEPVFDHAKVAIIDDIARLGLPAGNPFFGETGGAKNLAYYYLWHFSAAELSVLTGQGGWNADAGLTFFTAFASLLLMIGFAVWLSSRASSAAWALIIAASASIRPFFVMALGSQTANAITGYPTGFGGWLFQMMWAPQHIASANCAVVAVALIVKLSERPTVLTAIAMSLTAAASFQSSTWVGGVTFPLAALLIGALLTISADALQRRKFVAYAAMAAMLSVVLDAPFLYEQYNASILRADGFPIGIEPYSILGEEVPEKLLPLLNIAAYWTVFLSTEFAAFYPAGLILLYKLAKDARIDVERRHLIRTFGLLALVSLGVGSLLISTVADNNDLAWRGVLPAILVLIAATAAGLSKYLFVGKPYAIVLLGLVCCGAFQGGFRILENVNVTSAAPSDAFVKSEHLWAVVRKHADVEDRVANNPLFLQDLTPWPVNISWALLSNRRSCYAARDLALPFAQLPVARRAEVDALFTRVFSGKGGTEDVVNLARKYDCKVVVVTSKDGAWANDQFASSMIYELVDARPEEWRIYKRREN